MRFKVYMINDLSFYSEKTVIANNLKEAKRNVQTFNPISKVIEANGFINRIKL